MPETHQIAVKLDAAAFDALKRLSSATGKPYAAVIAAASSPLVETSAPIVYPLLSDDHRRPSAHIERAQNQMQKKQFALRRIRW